MRVLLIEDEPTTARAIELMLTTEGFNVYSTDLGEEGLDLGKLYDYDIILLDLNLPDMHGYDVLKKLRVAKVQTPVLILSGISEMDSKVRSFGFGADDYVTKPFAAGELLARLRALTRRASPGEPAPALIEIGGLRVELSERAATIDGAALRLTRKEFDVLALLARNAGRLVTHDHLLRTIWGPAHVKDTHYLRIAVAHLREKIGDAASDPRMIFTEPGIGYRMAGG